MEKRERILSRLQELKRQHEASLGEGPGHAPGFTQDEQATRKSYNLIVAEALGDQTISKADLATHGLPASLEGTREAE